jgi:hypothetical protein
LGCGQVRGRLEAEVARLEGELAVAQNQLEVLREQLASGRAVADRTAATASAREAEAAVSGSGPRGIPRVPTALHVRSSPFGRRGG